MLLFIVPGFFYRNAVNAVGSGGSTEIVAYSDGTWTNKLPVFFGAAMMGIATVFYVASRPVAKKNTALL